MSIFDGELKIQASAASGTEAVLKRELTGLGYAPGGAKDGRICFAGNFTDVARANIFLRTAGRVRIVVAEFPAATFDELYDGVRAVRWDEVFPRDAAVVVSAKSARSRLFSLRDIQSITKKAVADSLCARYGLARLPEDGVKYELEAAVSDDTVTLSLDTSGAGLHKRGYRIKLGEAPIRETLAASIILLSVWRGDRAFLDPFCGSGTLPIEAALIGTNTAPGLMRGFAFENFSLAPQVAQRVREEARALADPDASHTFSGRGCGEHLLALLSRGDCDQPALRRAAFGRRGAVRALPRLRKELFLARRMERVYHHILPLLRKTLRQKGGQSPRALQFRD